MLNVTSGLSFHSDFVSRLRHYFPASEVGKGTFLAVILHYACHFETRPHVEYSVALSQAYRISKQFQYEFCL